MDVERCGGATRSGTPCRNVKGYKTDHVGYGRCFLHGGASPNGRKAGERERVMSEIASLLEAERIDSDDPIEGLAEAERRARTMGRVLERVVSELEQWWGPNRLGDVVPHVAVDLLAQWTDKSARVSKLAIDAGLEERRTALSERQGEMLAAVLRTLLASLSAALVAAGLAEGVVQRVMVEDAPKLVRGALSVAGSEDLLRP